MPKTVSKQWQSWSWIFYDFANSAYPSVMVTAYYILYFKSAVVKDIYKGDLIWGKMIGGSMLILALIAPALGAIADEGRFRKRLLLFFTLLSVFATAILAASHTDKMFWCILLFCLSLIGYEAAITFYDSFLSNVSTKKTIGKISGLGFGLGYLGGLISIAVSYPFIVQGAGHSEWSMAPLWIASGQFLLFSLPAFFYLKEAPPNHSDTRPLIQVIHTGFSKLIQTLKELKNYPDLLKFLLAYLFFFDGIATVISFGGTFAKDTLGFETKEVFLVFIISNLVAVPGSIIGGYLTDRYGPKKTILVTLIVWILTLIALAFSHTKLSFFIVAGMVGIGLGSTQSAARTLYAQFIPMDQEARFFALKGLCGKVGTILGPILFGTISYAYSSQRIAALSLIVFFVTGFILVYFVNESRGRNLVAHP